MYHCLKYQDNKQQMSECWQLKEDGHCLYCPYYQYDEPISEIKDEIKEKVLNTFIEVTNLALNRNKKEQL